MTAQQFRGLLKRAGISHRELAHELEIDRRTVDRYASGEYAVPKTVVLATRWLTHVLLGVFPIK